MLLIFHGRLLSKSLPALPQTTPELFRRHFREALELAQNLPDERRFIFIKSWNEWAEGNHLEPDLKWGHDYLRVIAEELTS